MTEKPAPGRAAWLATARPAQLPPEKYDLWTLWADRAWGKSRAALEEALEWTRKTVDTPRGPAPVRVAVFVRSIDDGMSLLVYGQGGICNLSEIGIEVDRTRQRVRFANGAEWWFFRYSDADRAKGGAFHHALLEDSETARLDELEDVMRVLHGELKWAPDPRIVMTCNRLPPWQVHKLAGGRRHLTIGASAAENAGLPKHLVDAIERDRR